MKYRGVAYYPEAWPKERWDVDIELMREARVNLVRMGEFAWARFEPSDGRFELDWWREICARMWDADISVLACTPSAAPPAWLTTKHPEILSVDESGIRASHGGRRHYCPSSEIYRRYVRRVNEALAAALKDNDAVLGWQIDNEIAVAPCHCPTCAERFRAWLRRRYGSLDELNRAWGNVFWSGDFSCWSQIQPPRQRVSWLLDYRRFQDDVFIEFIAEQVETFRAIKPDWILTTNQWAGLNPAADSTRYFERLDLASYDGYWDYYAEREFYSAVWDFYRNLKGRPTPFWLTETNAWNPASAVDDGLRALRPWAYEAFAKGSEAHIYFRWRQSRMGEEDHPAVLDWSGRPGRPYEMVRELFSEMEGLAPELASAPMPECGLGILFDYDSAVCGELEGRNYRDNLIRSAALLNRFCAQPDIMPAQPELDLSKYRLILLPQLEMVDDWLAERLKDFTRDGGWLLAITRLATLDRNGKYTESAMPADMIDLFGIRVCERAPVAGESPKLMKLFPESAEPAPSYVEVAIELEGRSISSCGIEYMELLEPAVQTRIIGRYESGAFKGAPAITANSYGKGMAFYQGCRLDQASASALLRRLTEKSGAAVPIDLPAGVEVLRRGRFRFYLNHTQAQVRTRLINEGAPILGKLSDGCASLDPFGVCIVEEQTRQQ